MSAISNIHLRTATCTDSVFAYNVKKAALKEYVEKIWGWDEKFQIRRHRDNFKPEHVEIITLRGKDIGWLAVKSDKQQIRLNEIYFLPEYQNQGIGSQLVNEILDEAKNLNISVCLQVFKINPAVKLYKRLGFQITRETETHYLLEKKFND